MAFAPLDPVLHNQLRLAMASLLVGHGRARTSTSCWRKPEPPAVTSALQITKLERCRATSTVKKSFKDNYPEHALCALTAKGLKAFETYVQAIKEYLGTVKG
jgi:hypothetical protein